MKNKFLGKLILSGVTLAACATTLVTSTYAWYTSNNEVSTGSVTGNSSAEVSSSSIYVSSPAQYNSQRFGEGWSNYTNMANIVTTSNSISLNPVYFNPADQSYKRFSGISSEGTYQYAAEDSKDFIEFALRFRAVDSKEDVSVFLSNISATVTNPTVFTALASGTGTGITGAGSYKVDLMHALKMNVTAYDIPKALGEVDPSTNGDDVPTTAVTDVITADELAAISEKKATVYDLDYLANTEDNDDNLTVTDSSNAIGYYSTVTGTTITRPTGESYLSGVVLAPASDTGTTAQKELFKIGKDNGYTEVRFAFYIDGWDNYCYDVLRGQSVVISLEFTTTSTDSLYQPE